MFRAKTAAQRKALGTAMLRATANDLIGYSQPDRLALFNHVKSKGFDPAKATEATNTDCSALVRVCCYYAGIEPINFITSNEPAALLKTGAFTEMTDNKYRKKSDYLKFGDILVSPQKGHTVIVVSNGPKADADVDEEPVYALGDRELDNGDYGDDVKELQSALIQLGYSCGDFGADSEFGDCTEMAVIQFQRDKGLEADGVAGALTVAALLDALGGEESAEGFTRVKIVGGNCYVREEPGTISAKLGVARKGLTYIYAGKMSSEGWYNIAFNDASGWVSGKYAQPEV